ncbi:MAG: hypothetical protein CMO34_05460 [Verrucomicrobia bacterium]|nr:hypothetical protein [Verrucomicrobiota bacterium]|tara:strand:- start:817 stop:1713 length:897 start_codon:yes stop_codon:yes gene_type:complete
MLLLMSRRFNDLIESYCCVNPFSFVYGLGRSIIAIGSLVTFVFNDIYHLFDEFALRSISNSDIFMQKINFFGIFGYDNLVFAKLASIIILIIVISGFIQKLSCLLHFWINFSFYNSAILLDGGDQIATILSFLIIPLALFDKRRNHWDTIKFQSPLTKLIGHITFIMISIQVSFIYLNTAIEKIYKIEEWKNGTAIYYIANNNLFGVQEFALEAFSPILNSRYVFFITWFIILSHLCLSYVLFLDRQRKFNFFFMGVGFHLCIAFFLGLYSFSFVMIGALVLYLIPFNYKKITCSEKI